jgi:hypothetical protein
MPSSNGYMISSVTPIIPGLEKIGVVPEIVLNSGTNNIADYRTFFANKSVIQALVTTATKFRARGLNLDLEPQVP